jgi:hypothetical protein
VNQFSVVKHRKPHCVAHLTTMQSPLDSMENDGYSSDADSRDDDQVDDQMESSTDDSNYSEGKSGTSNSKEESGEEEEEDEVEDTVDNTKGILSTRCQRKEKCWITTLPLQICCVPTDRANRNITLRSLGGNPVFWYSEAI